MTSFTAQNVVAAWEARIGKPFTHDDARIIQAAFVGAPANLEALAQRLAILAGQQSPAPLHIVMACRIATNYEQAMVLVNEIEDLF